VSAGTVDGHVSRVFRKLRIVSRNDLRSALAGDVGAPA
jgi:DNA-binding CsgD family transcriptional regulator